MLNSIYEKGDSLERLAIKAREWFITNNIEVPEGAAMWQRKSVRRGEIPPGTGVTSLRKYGFNVTQFIATITQNTSLKPYNRDPITAESVKELGFEILKESYVNAHKKLLVKCLQCDREESITYGTLQRMKEAGNMYCRYCRNAGGKTKDISTYDHFTGFKALSVEDGRVLYECLTCGGDVERTFTHVSTAEYLICEHCYPKRNFGARMYTELGYFDSKIEYEAFKILLKYLNSDLIVRQKKYDELFNTGTQHTADFYLPTYNLVIEVTSQYNKIGSKYKETAAWKLSLSNINTKVIFAYSLSEVEDIVRSLVKTRELTVTNRRNVLRSSTFWGF